VCAIKRIYEKDNIAEEDYTVVTDTVRDRETELAVSRSNAVSRNNTDSSHHTEI